MCDQALCARDLTGCLDVSSITVIINGTVWSAQLALVIVSVTVQQQRCSEIVVFGNQCTATASVCLALSFRDTIFLRSL